VSNKTRTRTSVALIVTRTVVLQTRESGPHFDYRRRPLFSDPPIEMDPWTLRDDVRSNSKARTALQDSHPRA
jgi:hypothetical protein